MELDERNIKKEYRRRLSTVGWILLIYYGIMNASVFLVQFVEIMAAMIRAVRAGDMAGFADAAASVQGSAWGYFLAIAIGLLVLLLWKKTGYWKYQIWAKGKPMTAADFLSLLALFLSGQLIYQIVMTVVELILNACGLSVLAGMEAVSMDTGNFTMFLSGGIFAPITEEILFRGLIQRTLRPYGKRFAIIMSAFAFGIFHGNLLQTPYAFLVGLILGYVASEYSIGWAMLLHMINNLVLGDMLPRLTGGLPEYVTGLIIYAILLPCGIASLVLLIVRRQDIRSYRAKYPLDRLFVRCFFSSAGTVVLTVVMAISMIVSLFVMITPI